MAVRRYRGAGAVADAVVPAGARNPWPAWRATPSVALPGVTRVLSCMQPTGDVHLGSYLGALRHWVRGQHDKDVFHGIVDLHALTVAEEPGVVGARTLELAAIVLRRRSRPGGGDGVRAEPRHRALPAGLADGVQRELRRAVADDAVQGQVRASAPASSSPAACSPTRRCMAADILLYDTDEVPVGDDQRQHVEITRDIADPLQRALRRHVRAPGGGHAAGGRAGDGPAGPDVEDVEVGRAPTPG